MRTGTETLAQRATGAGLVLLTGAVLVFLVAPILVIVPLSFSSGSFFHYPLPGFSLRWYEDFFRSTFWLPSLKNSLIVGISATVLATGLGTDGGARHLARALSGAGAGARRFSSRPWWFR